MRWQDADYVKLYTYDSPEWLALPLSSRCFFWELMRKCDRAGIIRLGKQGVASLAAAVRGSLDEVTAALQPLIEDGCAVLKDDQLVIPNFVAAQNARCSDAARKRLERQRDRDLALADVQSSHAASRDVTPCPKGEERREEREREDSASPVLAMLASPASKPSSWDRIVTVWDTVCVPVGYAKARGTEKQRKAAGTRCRDPDWFSAFEAACRFLAATPFYRGKNDRGWAATLTWVLENGRAEELAERSATQKVRKESPEDAAIRAAWEESERYYTTPAEADDGTGYGPGLGGEGGIGAEAASLPLPPPREGLPADVSTLLGLGRPAGQLQDGADAEHGDQHGPDAAPGAHRVA